MSRGATEKEATMGQISSAFTPQHVNRPKTRSTFRSVNAAIAVLLVLLALTLPSVALAAPQAEPIGHVWAWGSNFYGQLGNGTTTDSEIPVEISNLSDVRAIATGGVFSLALRRDGTVWAWGANYYGQLGNNSTANSSVPVQVANLSGITAIAAGGGHGLALKNNGTVWTWGWNLFGQLGNGNTSNSLTPTRVLGLTGVTAVAGGNSHSLALTSNGTVWAWGAGFVGQLGDGDTASSVTPVRVSKLTDVTRIAAGEFHTLALKSDGTIWSWGLNTSGQLGNPATSTFDSEPLQVLDGNNAPLNGVTAVAGGGSLSLALRGNGEVAAWGDNSHGELGQGVFGKKALRALRVGNLTGVRAVAAGNLDSFALGSDGTVLGWGINDLGQLGNGTSSDSSVPVPVSILSGVHDIAAGVDTNLALSQ
jgi:alpha-tubulin suppressor-like RCC1 family protein